MQHALIAKNKKPAVIDHDNVTAVDTVPVVAAKLEKPNPSPTKILNTGPAKHAVIAIFANPFFAMVMLALKSPIELPHANTVKPITGPGMYNTIPIKFNKLTNESAIVSIHVAAIMNPYRAIGTLAYNGIGHNPSMVVGGPYRSISNDSTIEIN